MPAVFLAQHIEAGVGVGEFGDERGDGPAGIGGEQGSGDVQGERMVAAAPGEFGDRVGLPQSRIVGAGMPPRLGDQIRGAAWCQFVQAEQPSPEGGSGEQVPGGHQQSVRGAGGHEAFDL